jgi:hypothetical protein
MTAGPRGRQRTARRASRKLRDMRILTGRKLTEVDVG